MWLGYQNNKIVFAKETKEELENNCMKFDKIEESNEDWKIMDGEYRINVTEKMILSEKKRKERDEMLKETDVYMLPDFPITSEEKEQYRQYRQYLRDIPSETNFPDVDILTFEKWKLK